MPILEREPELFPESLFTLPATEPWWVAHVRSRQEKALARWLGGQGVPFYLPCREQLRRREGRRTVSYVPLFPGYLFFRGGAAERLAALRSQRLVRTLEVPDQAGLEGELQRIWRLQEAGLPLIPHPYLGPGDEVTIVDGPLRGHVGTVLREQGRLRLVVSVSMLRRAVAAVLDRDALAPLFTTAEGRRRAAG